MPSLTAPIDIVNMALTHCNQRTIESIADQNELARKSLLFYDPMRIDTLRACDWSFARKEVNLALIDYLPGFVDFPDWAVPIPPIGPNTGKDVPPQWNYFYGYPGDCLMIHKVFNPYHPILPDPFREYSVMHKNWGKDGDRFELLRGMISNVMGIATNVTAAQAKYTFDCADTSQFDQNFVTAFALKLAQKICMPLTGDKELKSQLDGEVEAAVTEAKRLNHSEGPEFAPRDSAYERARDQS